MMGEPAVPGALLRRHRLAAGLTQAELARRAGISIRALRDLEQGRSRAPRARSVQRLAAALRLPAAERDVLVAAVQAQSRPVAGRQRLQVGILGPLLVRRGDRVVEVRAPLQCALLGLLALQPGQSVPNAELIETLWGDDPPATCQALVSDYAARLRKLLESDRPARLPAPMVVRAGGGYRLEVDGERLELDLARFDHLAAMASRARSDGDPAVAYDLFALALGCWRGPLLADATARLRQHPVAVAVSQRRLAAALALADLAHLRGEAGHQQAVGLLRPLAHEEPLHEPLHARLMLALAGSGQQAAALRLFAQIRTRLAEELGIDPGAGLDAAHLRVLRGTPDGSDAASPGGHSDTGPSTDTGRAAGHHRQLHRL